MQDSGRYVAGCARRPGNGAAPVQLDADHLAPTLGVREVQLDASLVVKGAVCYSCITGPTCTPDIGGQCLSLGQGPVRDPGMTRPRLIQPIPPDQRHTCRAGINCDERGTSRGSWAGRHTVFRHDACAWSGHGCDGRIGIHRSVGWLRLHRWRGSDVRRARVCRQ
jgi:hypothetical protein